MKIWKYKLAEGEVLELPLVELLDVQIQHGEFVMWAVVSDNKHRISKVDCKFFMTGQEIDLDTLRHYDHKATLQDDMGMVWHVFIRID